MNDEKITIEHDEKDEKYEALLEDGTLVGILVYGRSGDRIVLTHAAIEQHYRGRGYGRQLISTVLDDIRSQGATITVICPVVREFIERHPEYADLVDPTNPGVRAQI